MGLPGFQSVARSVPKNHSFTSAGSVTARHTVCWSASTTVLAVAMSPVIRPILARRRAVRVDGSDGPYHSRVGQRTALTEEAGGAPPPRRWAGVGPPAPHPRQDVAPRHA